jgi:hypothetical protein
MSAAGLARGEEFPYPSAIRSRRLEPYSIVKHFSAEKIAANNARFKRAEQSPILLPPEPAFVSRKQQRKIQKQQDKLAFRKSRLCIPEIGTPDFVVIDGQKYKPPKGLSGEKLLLWGCKIQDRFQRRQAKRDRQCNGSKQRAGGKTSQPTPNFSPFYIAYMRSDRWKIKRLEAFGIHGKQCNRCGGFKKLQCHHLTYERLGKENVKTDLEIMCKSCHEEEHGRKF